MPAAAFVAASVLPHYGRSAPATGWWSCSAWLPGSLWPCS